MPSKKPRMDLPGRRATIPTEEECVRRMQNTAAVVSYWVRHFRDLGTYFPANERSAATQYEAARLRAGVTEGDYDHG